MPAVTFALTIVGYLGSAVLFYGALVRAPTSASVLASARLVLAFAVFAHLGDIVVRSIANRTCPMFSAAFALSLAAFVAILAFLISAQHGRLLSLGAIVVPIALGMFIASDALLKESVESEVPGWFLALHVLLNLSAVALLVLGAAAAIAYLVQVGRLKAKHPRVAHLAFPGLSSLETLMERSLVWGLGPMTLGVVSGAVFAERVSRGGVELVRVALAYACWLMVAGLFLGQRLAGYHGRTVAWGTVVVAVVAIAVVVLYTVSGAAPGGPA